MFKPESLDYREASLAPCHFKFEQVAPLADEGAPPTEQLTNSQTSNYSSNMHHLAVGHRTMLNSISFSFQRTELNSIKHLI